MVPYSWRSPRWLSSWSSHWPSPAWCCSWFPGIRWTRWCLSHPGRQLDSCTFTLDEVCHLFSIFAESESDEGILKLLDPDGSVADLVQGLEVFPQFQQCFICKIDEFFLAVIPEPVTLLIAALEELLGGLWDLLDLLQSHPAFHLLLIIGSTHS